MQGGLGRLQGADGEGKPSRALGQPPPCNCAARLITGKWPTHPPPGLPGSPCSLRHPQARHAICGGVCQDGGRGCNSVRGRGGAAGRRRAAGGRAHKPASFGGGRLARRGGCVLSCGICCRAQAQPCTVRAMAPCNAPVLVPIHRSFGWWPGCMPALPCSRVRRRGCACCAASAHECQQCLGRCAIATPLSCSSFSKNVFSTFFHTATCRAPGTTRSKTNPWCAVSASVLPHGGAKGLQ